MMDVINNWWKAEATRHFLWVPVCFAAGIAGYYGLAHEPARWLLPSLSLLSLLATVLLRRRALPLMLGLLLVMLGATLAQYRTHAHAPTMLRESLSPRTVLGVVKDIERTQTGVRLLLSNVTVDGLASTLTPKQIRLSVKFKKGANFELPRVGDGIKIRAGLMPPMGPALPGGFDFARYFYFKDIGAVGYGLPPWEVVGTQSDNSRAARFWTWRANLTDRIVKQLGAETGGIAAGLITGDGRAISEEDFKALRASNLYHIIAISGEHMVIISGVIFVALRLLMLLLPVQLALRPEGKSMAAALTLALVTLYLFVTGLPTSAVRAYVMIVLVLLAVLFRRHVDPMRSLAIAALLMLAYDPAMLLDPGFQLSFAATLAIVALVEARVFRLPPSIERGRVRMALHHMVTLVLVAVVAEAATAPLAISMFNNFSLYGVLANSLATPLVSLFLMPVVALFFILLPLGLEGFALSLLHYGISALLGLAQWVAGLPHAQLFVPTMPDWGLALYAIGLLWACLWHTRIRCVGALVALLGVATLVLTRTPDMLVTGTLKQVAFRSADGYVLGLGRVDAMIPEMWANGLGYKVLEKADTPHWRCDALGCVAQVNGQKVALPINLAALAEDCTRAKVIIAAQSPVKCTSNVQMIDARALTDNSVTALWLGEGASPRIESSADWQGERPWSVRVDDGEE
jgi:competence protein ComEC